MSKHFVEPIYGEALTPEEMQARMDMIRDLRKAGISADSLFGHEILLEPDEAELGNQLDAAEQELAREGDIDFD